MGSEVVPDGTTLVNHHVWMKNGIAADSCLRTNDNIGTDGSSGPYVRRLSNYRCRMNARRGSWSLIEKLQRLGKVMIRIGRDQRGGRCALYCLGRNHCSGPTGFHLGRILKVREKA